MDGKDIIKGLDLNNIPTPCYLINEEAIRNNCIIINSIKKKTGCKILLALKSFAMFSTFPIIREYLDGVCASSPNEARLGREKFGKEVHSYAPAYGINDIKEISKYSDHIVFNSFSQFHKFKNLIPENISCGIRINPEYSEVENPICNPCNEFSRLGVTIDNFKKENLSGIEGLHFHALCEQNSDSLEHVLSRVKNKFGDYIKKMKWINFGGGHHITRADYDVEKLISLIENFKKEFNVEIILEPGEAIALNSGVLIASVLDIIKNKINIAILDTSASAHMPDVLEMPYRPEIIDTEKPKILPYTYRLGGLTCLAGDIIGDYSFKKHLNIGDKIIFCDMAHYTMVKNNTFNGVKLPSIILYNSKTGKLKIVKRFGYNDYKNRLS